jgi:hypothetical protein
LARDTRESGVKPPHSKVASRAEARPLQKTEDAAKMAALQNGAKTLLHARLRRFSEDESPIADASTINYNKWNQSHYNIAFLILD